MNEFALDFPYNIESEQALLGAILSQNKAFDRVATFLEPEHFFEALHGRIFKVAGALIADGKMVTPVTIKTYFDDDEALAQVGGGSYLARLAFAATTIINAEEYGRTIHDLAVRRELMQLADELMQRAAKAAVDDAPGNMVEAFDARLTEIVHGSSSFNKTMMTSGEAARQAVDRAADAYRRDGIIDAVGLSTGLTALDEILGPLEGGMQVVLAGAPSMGKTALAQGIAYHNALAGKRGLGISQEMRGFQWARRWVAQVAGVDASRIRMGRFSEQEYARIDEAAKFIDENIDVNIDEARNLNVRQIAARARAMKRHGGLDFIVVDYLQLLAPLNPRDASVRSVTENSKALRDLAGDLDVPMILLSQLSREYDKRDNKRPRMSDLRESGAIEQDADAILFVHREQYYLEKSIPEEGTPEFLKWSDAMSRWQGKAEIIVPKLREGAAGGTAIVGFNGPLVQFTDIEPFGPMSDEERASQEALAL